MHLFLGKCRAYHLSISIRQHDDWACTFEEAVSSVGCLDPELPRFSHKRTGSQPLVLTSADSVAVTGPSGKMFNSASLG